MDILQEVLNGLITDLKAMFINAPNTSTSHSF